MMTIGAKLLDNTVTKSTHNGIGLLPSFSKICLAFWCTQRALKVKFKFAIQIITNLQNGLLNFEFNHLIT